MLQRRALVGPRLQQAQEELPELSSPLAQLEPLKEALEESLP